MHELGSEPSCMDALDNTSFFLLNFGRQVKCFHGGHPIWHETFLPLGTPHPLPCCAGVERRLRTVAPQNRWRSREAPAVAHLARVPLRRARLASGRLFEAAVLHLLWTDNSAGLAGHVKRRS